MVFSWRWLLVAFALVLGCGSSFAAGSTKEERAYAAAVSAFQDRMYDRAEAQFAQFIEKYPSSSHAAEAVLLQAQAEFKQGKLKDAIARLADNQPTAGTLADEYVYWTGEAQFQGSNYATAVETFNSFAQNFPASRLRLGAIVEAASALSRLGEWTSMAALLQETNGVCQRAARLDPGGELVARGWLLLAQAKLAQKDCAGELAVLTALGTQPLKPELDGQRAYLLYQNRLAAGDFAAALAATTNLLQIKDGNLRAEGVAAHATVLEKMGRADEALAAYQENLANGAPVSQQRQAVLKIAELGIAQRQFSVATNALEKFLAQFPGSPSADITLLTLGELHLEEHVASRSAGALTNHLAEAEARFDQFIGTFTNSALLGKAYLDRGWCAWLAGKVPESLIDFKTAAQKLPPSEDLAVARFKLGDVLFDQRDFTRALASYQSVADDFTNFPAVAGTLVEQALYQGLRASLELKDMKNADAALTRILKSYPAGDLADNAILLVGEGVADAHRPADARALFQKFEEQFPNSELSPQAQLAVARTYEQEQNWPDAIRQYAGWQEHFPTNELRPQVAFALALANFQAGNETNAFVLFTNFVAQFPTNELAPQAQWWSADYFFHAGDFVSAERNYKYVFQNWPASDLAFQARMMAGRAAVARSDYAGAIRDYFSKLEVDTNCDVKLRVQATFAHGDALMRSDAADTNNPLANFQAATGVFGQVVQLYPTNEWGALAWFYTGECDVQMASYDAATNAYAQVFNSAAANISARSQAKIGFGIALEKKAALAAGDEQAGLLELAQDSYLEVFDASTGTNLREGEVADDFWVKKAGLQALPLIEQLGESSHERVNGFIDHMEALFPQARESLEKKRAALLSGKN